MDKKFFVFILIVIAVISIDLITKQLAEKYLSSIGKITIIPGFFDLTLVWNRGAAFGVLAQSPEIIRKLILIGASSIAAVLTIAYAYLKKTSLSYWEIVSLSLIAGGAIGNLYDRIFIGAVRDFLDFYVKNYHWPAFNVADMSITLGISLFIFYEIFIKQRK